MLLEVIFLSAFYARVEAFPGWPTGGILVTGNAVQFDRETWERELAQPNATGSSSVTGFDLSQRWPSQQVDGWTLSLNVSRDIPDSQTLNPTNGTGRAFTGTSIFLRAPNTIQESFSDQAALDNTTWKICVAVIPNGPLDDSSEDGTCSFLSSQCITDLQQAYADKFSRNQDCYGTPPSTPSSCGSLVNTANFGVQQFPLSSVNGTEVFVTASDGHDAGNETAWDNATRQVWPVLTTWGWNVRANAPNDSSPQVQLSCIRANNIEPGSEPPASLAKKLRGSVTIALGVAGSVAFIVSGW